VNTNQSLDYISVKFQKYCEDNNGITSNRSHFDCSDGRADPLKFSIVLHFIRCLWCLVCNIWYARGGGCQRWRTESE